MSGEILTGIASLFGTGTSLYTNLGGRLYSRHMDDPTFPYGIIDGIPQDHTWTFTEDYYEAEIGVNIFSQSESETEISTLLNNVTDLFDDAVIAVSGFTTIWMVRERIVPLTNGLDYIRGYKVIYSLMLEDGA